MTHENTAIGIARYRLQAQRCRRISLAMATDSPAKFAMERLARRWDLMARAEAAARPANDA